MFCKLILVSSLSLLRASRIGFESEPGLFEGDIILPPLNDVVENSLGLDYRWRNGVVPYKIEKGFSHRVKSNILRAMKGITRLVGGSCVKFVPANNASKPFLTVYNRGECSAALGSRRDSAMNLGAAWCKEDKGGWVSVRLLL